MNDLAGGIETRNYGINRRTDRRNLFELLCIMLSIAAMAGVVFCYIWVRIQIVNTGYGTWRSPRTTGERTRCSGRWRKTAPAACRPIT